MNRNPVEAQVTARIIFTGVMLTCINQEKQYEVGMIQCPVHQPTITVVTKTNGVDQKSVQIVWPSGHDLLFQVTNPEMEGVSPYPAAGADTDFERIIDLEGPGFHEQGVQVRTELLQGRRLAVTAGRLYTHELSDVEFDLLTWTNETEEGKGLRPLGRIADEIGLNINCREGSYSGIQIVDIENGETVKDGLLPALSGTTYEIRIDNDCRADVGGAQASTIGSDFRFYYDFVDVNDGLKFDLGFRVSPNVEPSPSPDACEATFLSQTDTLGLRS
jgi:hypothetical protein